MLKLIQIGNNKRINPENINAVTDYGKRIEIQMIGAVVEIKNDKEWLEKTRAFLEQHHEETKRTESELPLQKEMGAFAERADEIFSDDDIQEAEFEEVDPDNHELPAVEVIDDGADLIDEAVDETLTLDAIEDGLCVNYITCDRLDIHDNLIKSTSMCVKDVNTYGCYADALLTENDTLCSNFHVCDDRTKNERECIADNDGECVSSSLSTCYRLPKNVIEDLEVIADVLEGRTEEPDHPDLCQIFNICVRPPHTHNKKDCIRPEWARCYMAPKTCANYRECMLNDKDREVCIDGENRDCYIDPTDTRLQENDGAQYNT